MNEHLNGVRGDARKRIEAQRVEGLRNDPSLLQVARRNSVLEARQVQWDVRRLIRRFR